MSDKTNIPYDENDLIDYLQKTQEWFNAYINPGDAEELTNALDDAGLALTEENLRVFDCLLAIGADLATK